MKRPNLRVPATLLSALFVLTTGSYADEQCISPQGHKYGAWKLHGFDRGNTADSSKVSRINKNNVNDLKLKYIYALPLIPPVGVSCPVPYSPDVLCNPANNPRGQNAFATGPGVDRKGRIYTTTFDGRILVFDGNTVGGANTDPNLTGTNYPKILYTIDLFADPSYMDTAHNPPQNIYSSRMFTTLIGDDFYAGGNDFYGSWAFQALDANGHHIFSDKMTETPSPTNPEYKTAGATLYKLDRRTGALEWRSNIESNPHAKMNASSPTPIKNTKNGDIMVVGIGSSVSGNMAVFPLPNGNNPFHYPDPYDNNCCDVRGAVAGVRISDGKVMWKTYTMPSQKFPTTTEVQKAGNIDAYMGGSVWGGGNFPYSKKNGLVYVGVGEAYSAYAAADTCETNRLNGTGEFAGKGPGLPRDPNNTCLRRNKNNTTSPASAFNKSIVESGNASHRPVVNSPVLPLPSSVMAIDVNTGAIKWAKPISGFDVWNLACFEPYGYLPPPNSFVPDPGWPAINSNPLCPTYIRGFFSNLPVGPGFAANPNFGLNNTDKDLDVGEQPVLIENVKMADKSVHDVLIVTTKGAAVVGFDAANGKVLWGPLQLGPGDLDSDGIVWGSATDGKRFFTRTGRASNLTLSNVTDPAQHVVQDGSCFAAGFDSSGNWKGGMYVAIDIASGKLAWQRCVVGTPIVPATRLIDPSKPLIAGQSQTPISVSNGVVIAFGATGYKERAINTVSDQVFSEILLLDAETGALLRKLPVARDYNSASSANAVFQRPIAVGKRLYITTGGKGPRNGLLNPLTDGFQYMVVYELGSDTDEYNDDNN